jgi:hypothetical protein
MSAGAHAIQRAKERYGLELTVADLRNICHIVQNNQAKLDKINANKTTTWFLNYNKTHVRVVISPDFYAVVTFIPLTDAWRGKKKPTEKKRRRKKVYRGGRPVYVEMSV